LTKIFIGSDKPVNNLPETNFENINSKINSLTDIVNLLADKIDVMSKQHNIIAPQPVQQQLPPQPQHPTLQIQPTITNRLWADSVKTPDDDGFTTVQHRAKRPRVVSSDPSVSNPSQQTSIYKPIKGKCKTENSMFQANKKIRKSCYHVGKLKKCKKQNLLDYLEPFNIKIIGCYPLIKKSVDNPNIPRPSDDFETTSFKVIILSEDDSKFFDPEIWPKEALVTRWDFTDKPHIRQNETSQKVTQF